MKPPAKNQKWPCLTSTYSDQIKKGIIKIHPPVLSSSGTNTSTQIYEHSQSFYLLVSINMQK